MKYAVCLILWALLLVSCGDSDLGDDINGNNLPVYSTVEDLPPCTAANEGEQLFVKSEGIIRVCADEKWFATMNRLGGCTTEPLSDSSGVKILCDGDSVGVVLNGKNGANGTNAVLPDTSENGIVVLDSEKVATSLEGVSGYSQKGPFINGSKVTVIELESGRSLNQTGNTFESKILTDDGQFKLNARMMVSQYVELHAEGYYRNEVTGGNSEAPLTLYAITDVSKRDGGIVNINLLTHLEYHRVVYLVTQKKMKVFAAKKQAEREIFALLHIDSKDFFSSEDLNIAGSSEGDAALLAFSVMFQGDRSVSQLTELLTNISTDMEKDSTWDNTKVRDSIADWAESADATGKLDTIRANVEGWGLSKMVPNFEKYVRSFWTKEYNLPTCDKDNINKLFAAGVKRLEKSDERYICVDSAKIGYIWRRANDFEKDTYDWPAGKDGEMKNGTVNKTARYIYDSRISAWRVPKDYELLYGGCTDAVAADNSKNVVYSRDVESVKYGYDTTWAYTVRVCMNHEWKDTSLLYIDTRTFGVAEDATVRKGAYSDTVYVYETATAAWRYGTYIERDIGLGCTQRLMDTIAYNPSSSDWYKCIKQGHAQWICDKAYDPSCQEGVWYDAEWATNGLKGCKNDDHGRIPLEEREGYRCIYEYVWDDFDSGYGTAADTYDEVCTEAKTGRMRPGLVKTQSLFVCDNYDWREASPIEERLNLSCTQKNRGDIAEDTLVCDSSKWRDANFFDYPAGHFLETDGRYGSLHDSRDGKDYKTIVIRNHEWMAENLNFDDGSAYSGPTCSEYEGPCEKCYGNKPTNCEKGGRYYTWAEAMNIDKKWANDLASEAGKIKAVHQGICPDGWHIPTKNDWFDLFAYGVTPIQLMARNIPAWRSYGDQITNESGFTAYPLGTSNFVKWWSADEHVYDQAVVAKIPDMGCTYESKVSRFPVRCVKDPPAGD